jgi:proliferating cell nuclear antigen
MSFKLEINDLAILKSCVNAVSNISNDFSFTVDENGLSSNGISTGHTSFYDFVLTPDFFDSFNVDGKVLVNVDIQELKKVMGRAANSDIGIISLKDEELNIVFEGEAKREFSLRLQDNIDDELSTPAMEFNCKLELPLSYLKDSIKNVSLFTDQLIILEVNEDKIVISGKSDKSKVRTEYIHGEPVKGEFRATYDVSLIDSAVNQLTFVDRLQLEFDNDKPLKITSQLVTEDGRFSTLTAPRIEESD